MAETEKRKTEVRTPKFRLSYPHLHKPKLNEAADVPKKEYTVDGLFPKDSTDMKAMRIAVKRAVIDEWGSWDKKPPKFKHPIKDGDEMDNPQYAGHWVVTMKSSEDYPPRVITRRKDKDGKFIDASPKEIYGGCWGHAVVNAYAYNMKANKGVSFGLQAVQKYEDGDKFGGAGSVNVDEEFSDFESDEDEDVMETDDDSDDDEDTEDFG